MKARRTVFIFSAAILMGLTGFACQSSETVSKDSNQQTKAVAQTPAPQPVKVVADGRIKSSYAFPTGHRDTSVLLLERDLPAQIVGNQEFSYEIKVTNIGHAPIDGVSIRDECASELVLTRSEPAALAQKPPFVWNLGSMKPNETRTVRIFGKTTGSEQFTSCASATYNSAVCLTAPIVEPGLRVAVTAPAEVTPCDPIPVRITVTNTGTGDARDVRVTYQLPEGWTTSDGKNTVLFSVGALASKQSQEFIANAKASRTGDFMSRVNATAWPELKSEATAAATSVRQAVLAVKAEGPTSVYSNRHAVLSFAISNNGTAVAKDTMFEVPLPQGTKLISSTEGGKLAGSAVTWNLREIPIKGTRQFSMTVEPTMLGKLDITGTAKAYCAEPARATASVTVQGIPALLLEVTDLLDPIEVFSNTTYEIVITNQGTADARNVRIVASLEDNHKFISASDGTKDAIDGVIKFAPIAYIAPKAKVKLTVVVQCVKDGDARFKVSMTADQLTRPVEETESTTIYR